MINIFVRVNGRGNAWPLELGSVHNPRYAELHNKPEEFSNTSFSVLGSDDKNEIHNLQWEVLIDVGAGIVPFLLRNNNRLPDALILSHPHYDHICGLDWLVQSYKRNKKNDKRLPVYATRPCWDAVLQKFGYLESNLEFRELIPGKKYQVNEANDLTISAFPVFHGDYAPGAILLLVEYANKKVVFTNDLLCPLLRDQDIRAINGSTLLFLDANMRYPWPQSGHWSIVGYDYGKTESDILKLWRQKSRPAYLTSPHLQSFNAETYSYLDQFISEIHNGQKLYLSIFDFVHCIQPQNIQLVHYSGAEDKHHGQNILTDSQLLEWVQKEAVKMGLASINWSVAKPGDYFPAINLNLKGKHEI